MDSMSPQQQQQECLSRGGGQQDNKRRFQSYRRQSAPSLVLSKALTRSKTLSRESFLVPVCPETCPLVQSFLTGAERSFLLHGQAQLKAGMQTQDRHLFLFTDLLVIAKAKSANHFKQKTQVSVRQMWTASCTDEVCEGSTSPERSFVMGWPTWNCVAMFSSAEQKEKWLSVLKSRIKAEKDDEEPKTIPLRVYGKGINTFAVTKTLPVSNWDPTNEVIRLALQQFGIIGQVKDHQLWVLSKRDNTPYPLIGHEFPFSIQMSHVRGGGARDAAAPPPTVEQLQASKQCQFILKPRPAEPPRQQHVPADFSQKPFKRRRSLITWAFWRGSSSHLNELSLAGPRGCLFGQPLAAVCLEDALPKPVMDMLSFLYHEGAWTRGIFRRSAGARAVRELRDSLDGGGGKLPLTRDHVFIIAGVFKDFLRSIPGSLLRCELHEDWTDVLEEEDEEDEQVQDVVRMIFRVGKENIMLLRYLLAMLHGIQGNAQENQMTSFNLSVCIAPSMLWPPGEPCSSEMEGEGTRKVCELVKFMIDHCQRILGVDPASLFGGPPQRLDEEEMASESWPYPLTDSSYDSLENELDNSSAGSPGSCSRRRLQAKPLQGSLDSILTCSDYDQNPDPEVGRPRGLERRRRRELSPSGGVSSTLDSLSLEGGRSQRRCSEPAIAYPARLCPYVSSSADALTGDEDDAKDQPPKRLSVSRSRRRRGWGDGCSAGLRASTSSLSSTPVSPAPTHCSLNSLDSLSDHQAPRTPTSPAPLTWVTGPKDPAPKDPAPKEPLSKGALKSMGLHPNCWLKKDRRLSLTQPEPETEGDDRTGVRSRLQTSYFLLGGKRDHDHSLDTEIKMWHFLFSIRQHDLFQYFDVSKLIHDPWYAINRPDTMGGLVDKPAGSGKPPSSQPRKSRRGSRDGGERVRASQSPHGPHSPLFLHSSTGNLLLRQSSWFQSSESPLAAQISDAGAGEDVSSRSQAPQSEGPELKPPSLFYKPSGPSLSLFRRHKTPSAEDARLRQRRGSEPGRQVVDRAATLTPTRARLPSDPGLKVSEVDGPEGAGTRFCLSPCTTKAVRDYFSGHPGSHPQSSQQVALALVESRREWRRRCSEPTLEPDIEQLLFAEESFV
ncbi:rho GTPase-activating protein 20-like [Cololabis saira]|uniref:rho GTPase-activating protein 20-like n=1 Tax=Cololabis saira TaxID=129043 RepID=UPI002AD30581|nr:rho GTPase-activating protein 20-like [Cololabis saira]